MRKNITEREVYKKLEVLERHSAFKQPYKFKTHVNSELNWEPKGYPWTPPGAWPPYPPVDPSPEACDFGCNPSMLDCEGGCTTIVCTCPIGGAEIILDPTGSARLMSSTSSAADPFAGGGNTIAVCIDDATCLVTDEYAKILQNLLGHA